MTEYKRDEFSKYFESPIQWFYQNRKALLKDDNISYESLRIWIGDQKSKLDHADYNSSNEVKLVDTIAPTNDAWKSKISDLYVPFLI